MYKILILVSCLVASFKLSAVEKTGIFVIPDSNENSSLISCYSYYSQSNSIENRSVCVKNSPLILEKEMTSISVQMENHVQVLKILVNKKASHRLHSFSKENLYKNIILIIKGKVISNMTIVTPLINGEIKIAGLEPDEIDHAISHLH
ncbi:MAG: hypothetical protein OEY19_01770 [Gammaproteobacteria bacterium]|nr:hypothetical protein [Gammaproteobacteria bacterium]MDH5628839.1 hypothetical protein [Gammaproteobacteria bacterium]